MDFARRSAKRKRAHELRCEMKQLRKRLIMAGCDKSEANRLYGILEETVLSAAELSEAYAASSGHMEQAKERIDKLLEKMGESPAEEVKKSLEMLMAELELIYHDCMIREDDLDFQATITGLSGLIASYGERTTGQNAIMLRSELENTKAVLDDASGFGAPDFFALAYYNEHGDKSSLKEMENEQRNRFLEEYLREHFSDAFWEELKLAHLEDATRELIERYV